MKIPMDYELACAASMDAANRAMRASGRKKWSKKDYNIAVRTMHKLLKTAHL